MIVPRLYLGNVKNATTEEELKHAGHEITDILRIMDSKYTGKKIDDICYDEYMLADLVSEAIPTLLKKASDFIATALKNESARVLVYSDEKKKLSRASVMVAAYLMASKNMTSDQALKLINQKRAEQAQPACVPNNGFKRQLKAFNRKSKGSR